jgi:hypothetical protein
MPNPILCTSKIMPNGISAMMVFLVAMMMNLNMMMVMMINKQPNINLKWQSIQDNIRVRYPNHA